jgi:CHAT domain-containing protein/tetratricopeptide (TPR) repeat protein
VDAESDTDAAAAAQRLVDDGSAPPAALGVNTLAVAWALKGLCYAAWNNEPARAVRAAHVLATLDTRELPREHALQVQGLAAWTDGLANVAAGQMAPAVVAFDRAAQLLRQAGQPDAAAQTQVPKIMALSLLGQPEQATACAEAAQTELLALGNVAAASRVSLNLGSLLLRRDAYADACRHYRQAAVLFARLGDHFHSVLADIGLAGALTSLGDFDEALRIYARVRMRAAQQSLGYPLAVADESVALMDLARGRYGDALAGMESARQRYEELGLPHALAVAEKQLADAYLDLRLLPEALALFDTAAAKLADLRVPEEQAWAVAQRGRTQALLGRVSLARESFAAAAALFGESGHAVGLSSVTLALAELALAQGHTTVALAHAHTAAAGFAQAGQVDGQARSDVVRAQALWQDGQWAAARQAFDSTLLTARQHRQLQVQVRCLTGQAIAAHAGGDTAAAQLALDEAINLLEDQRRALPGEDLRSAFLTEHLRPYQEQLRLALVAGDPAQVLLQLERYRARSLADKLDEGEAEQDAQARAEGDPELRERLQWLYRRVQRLQDEDERSPALQDELHRAEHELLERARRRRLAAHPVAADLPGAATNPAAFSVAALQAALSAHDAVVEYGVLDDELFALIVTRSQLLLQRHVASWAQVVQALHSTRFQIETLRHGVAPVQAHLAAITHRTQLRLQQLHALVWAPLQDTLRHCTRLMVVPHAQLAALPFGALQAAAGRQTSPATERPLLGQQFQWALVPSARAALRGLQRQPVPARRALVLGDSLRLPHAAREAQWVAGLFTHSQALVGEQATLAALQAQAADADVIHLACHAQFRHDNPRFSALHLQEGALTVELAESLRLRAGTVVLSACESGLAEHGGGDEMVGLVRAFLMAGAARVVATLWPVDDAATADFMAHFYGALMAGHAPSMALQEAQSRLRQERPEPYFWAAFTLYGGW